MKKCIVLFQLLCMNPVWVFAQNDKKVVNNECSTPKESKWLKVLIIRKNLDDKDAKEAAAAVSITSSNGKQDIYQVDAALGFNFRQDKNAFQVLPLIEWHRNTGIEKPQNAFLFGANGIWEPTIKGRKSAVDQSSSFSTHQIAITPKYAYDGVNQLKAYQFGVFWSPKRYVGILQDKMYYTKVCDGNRILKTKNGEDSLMTNFFNGSRFFQANAEYQFKKQDEVKKWVVSSYISPQVGIEYQNRFQAENKGDALGELAMLVLKLNWSLKLNDIRVRGVVRPVTELTVDYQNRVFDLKNTTTTVDKGMKQFLSTGIDFIVFQNDISKASIGVSYTVGQDPTKFLQKQEFVVIGFKIKRN
jgi:hypothetical protein